MRQTLGARGWGWLAPCVVITSTLALPGCRGCAEEKPYTPFTVTDSAALPHPSASAAPPAASASATAPFAPASAVVASPAQRTLEVSGRTVAAPPDHALAAALGGDFDGDGVDEIVAWAVPDRGRGGSLWVVPATGAAREVWQLPGFVPSSEDCVLTPKLRRTGPHTVSVDVAARCASSRIARTPVRSLAVLFPLGDRVEGLSLRVAEPAPGEQTTLELTTVDRDGDGRDDVGLQVRLATARTTEPVDAKLEWIDRAAGPSREAREPLASLVGAARAALASARGRSRCTGSLERIDALRRLTVTLCAEGGTPRLFDREGNPFRCGDPAPLGDLLAEAEVEAALACDDPIRAAGVLTRDGWFLAPLSTSVRAKLIARLEAKVAVVTPTSTKALVSRVAPPSTPRWSPLRFEQPEATLLVRTPAGMMRASADGASEAVAEPSTGAVPWSLEVRGPTGGQWTSVSQACDRSELLLGLADGGAEATASDVLAARPGACAGRPVPATPAPVPLGFTTREGAPVLSAIVAGMRTGPDVARAEPGSARSPDGRRLALATALGVLVTGGERPELWRGPELQPLVELSDCVPANDAVAIACVHGDRVLLARR